MIWLNRLASFVFPNRCLLCGEIVEYYVDICSQCRQDLYYAEPPFCQKCGRGLRYDLCGGREYAFVRNISMIYYTGKAKKGLVSFKAKGERSTAAGFAKLILPLVKKEYGGISFDYITNVPITKKQKIKRGFNHQQLFALELGRSLGIRYKDIIDKIRDTRPQHSLELEQRLTNLRDAFSIKPDINLKGKTVLLCDDMFTTGATLDECSKVMREKGAEVYTVTIAITGRN